MTTLQRIPPSPKVMNDLYLEYLHDNPGIPFAEFLEQKGLVNHSHEHPGMDDSLRLPLGLATAAPLPQLIDIPRLPVRGAVKVKVLLVDFADRAGALPAAHYEELLFSQGSLPTGSMREYYSEVSRGAIDITGSVHGWLRLPQPYAFYTNNASGTGGYPGNAQKMAEDAVQTALASGVTFEASLDVLHEGQVTALFIIHAGVGAETIGNTPEGRREIWSHKWAMQQPVTVAPGLVASTYLTVPHDCRIGVCAHELGHLVMQWEDFYDINGQWSGTGFWDLMASGSWGAGGVRPTHPIGLHKLQHGWVEALDVTTTVQQLTLPPVEASGQVVKVVSPAYRDGQYLILENRANIGFDKELPGEGLLVWRIDEAGIMTNVAAPGALLIQADGLHQLENSNLINQGDDGDPFPGLADTRQLDDDGNISTSFPAGPSGVTLTNIAWDLTSKTVTLDILFENAPPLPEPMTPGLIVKVDIRGRGIESYTENQLAGCKYPFLQVERFSVQFNQAISDLGLEYHAVLGNNADTGFVAGGAFCGQEGERIIGFAVRLTGAQANRYTVTYRGKFGIQKPTEWVSDGTLCAPRGGRRYGLKGLYVKIEKR
ncbi:immune inhibitor A [Catalinimonas alkaloidigena]|uniref:Immune inhibitor A n=1 Tax=Catalinimonas alkaloidigena TaxID=1075417 RepID=A0A1G9N9C9_9BACT|nr:M6 family metalloprotease domain-containing protein [Catalinimonas alkaloidigena]SDL83108.1 immune inhibitor A [Catalinimonas alkaloidigena]